MSVNASWLRMFAEMKRRHQIDGPNALALGLQDVMFTHRTAEDLLRERRLPFTAIEPSARTFASCRAAGS